MYAGRYLTAKILEFHSHEIECSLSDILEDNVPDCPHFICTHGGKGIRLYTKNIKKHYEVSGQKLKRSVDS